MSDISENESMEENLEVPLSKQKKTRSQAQIEAFEKSERKETTKLGIKETRKIIKFCKITIGRRN